MSSIIFSSTLRGIQAELISVEASVAPGLPSFVIVGLPDTAIQESRERVRAALRSLGFPLPQSRLTVNLAPADLRKIGPAFDLPIAISILCESGILDSKQVTLSLFLGELSLDGKIRAVSGVLPSARLAQASGIKELYVPVENSSEGILVDDVVVFTPRSLKELVSHLQGTASLVPISPVSIDEDQFAHDSAYDFAHIEGHAFAKRALEIAASGGHNIFLSGPPGSGKTLLAKSLPSILPPMSKDEIIEVTSIYSAAGLTNNNCPFITDRPFRSPHHSMSSMALVGGGAVPRPGEVSLAQHGVLFLDELPEFARSVLENLRQPLEEGSVTLSRVHGRYTFPAHFIFVAAQNPCPCGFASDPERECVCRPEQIQRYAKKISGPLLDRIDMVIEVPRISSHLLFSDTQQESSNVVRKRVCAARNIQIQRFSGTPYRTNTEIPYQELASYVALESSAETFLISAAEKLHLSARVVGRILRVSRTIADLASSDRVTIEHISEALRYRAHSLLS